ncbi:MAG TPA: ABC transporter permease [Candidatus Angelobacter sp.]
MQTFLQDLRYAVRQIRNQPGFAAVTILVLALGIGVSTATFTVLNAVLLRKPAFSEINRLVTLAEPRGEQQEFWGVSLPDVRDWRAQSRSMEQIAYYYPDSARWERDSGTTSLDVIPASANFFATLGVQPALGRTFSAEEEQAKAKVVVLNHAMWQESFASDRKVLGQTLKLNGAFYEIIGVMPGGFEFPLREPRAVWKPLASTADDEKRESSLLTVFGRLRPGFSVDQAQIELSTIQKAIAQGNAKDDLPDRVAVRRYWDTIVGKVRPALLLLAGAVVLIWLVACANVASLMLTRNSVRQREIAIRRALGAGRLRLVRQLLTENMLYSAIAAGLGFGLALAAVRLLEHRLVSVLSLQGDVSLRMDTTVLLMLIALSVVSTLVFGLLPALQASAAPVQKGLQVKSGHTSGRQSRLRDSLVVGELAVSLLLLVAAGLLLRTLSSLHHVPLGFSTENIITSAFVIPQDRYQTQSVTVTLYEPMIERIKQIPGVQSAAITSVMPLKRGFEMVGMFGIAGRKRLKPSEMPQADLRFSSPEYPRTMGITVERGRFFDGSIDTPTSQPVAVVNHAFAAKYLPGEDPTQKALSMGRRSGWSAVPIVGVIADVRQRAVELPAAPEIHLSTTQLAVGAPFYNVGSNFAQIGVRTLQKPETLIAAIRKAAHDVAPEVATGDFNTMTEVVEDTLGSQTLAARLVSLFAGATLLIAITGLYGLLSYSVRQRTQEIGIRMALGAQRNNVLVMVLRRALLLLLLGLSLGVVLAFSTSRLLRSFLYGVHERDVMTTVAVSLLLCLCGILAAYLPARRAASVDPIEALRTE